MKITTFLIFVAFMQVSAKGLAQRLTLIQKDVTLKQVFKEINKQTGYNIFWSDSQLSGDQKVNANFKDASLLEVLNKCLENTHLTYTVENKTVVIKEKPPTILDKIKSVFTAPSANITGIVTDSLSNPLIGATVALENTKFISVTDADGKFAFTNVPNGKYKLVITYVGYKKYARDVEVNGGNLTFPRLILYNESGKLTEVVVSTGYQTIPQERATGSFAQPDKDMYNLRVSTDVISKLDGITSGLAFNKDAFGNTVLRIRGLSTIFANADPLIVIDNFPYEGDINNINPNDVESVTVLKDAAAASIWGVRAGNGVIVITTKRGRLNQPLKVGFNSNVTVSDKPNLKYDRNFLDANDFINVEQYLFNQGFYSSKLTDPTFPAISPVVNILNEQQNGQISASDANSQINALRGLDERNDLSKYFYRRAVNQQYGLNLSGGTDKETYYFSTGYDNDLQSQVGSKFDRITINSLNTFTPIKNLTLTAGLNYTQSITKSDNSLSELNNGISYPYMQLASANGTPLPVYNNYNQSFVQSAQANGFLNWQLNPLQELQQHLNTSSTNEYEIRAIAGLKYTFFRGLNIDVKYQYERGINEGKNLIDQNSYYARNLANEYSNVTPTGQFSSGVIPLGGILNTANSDITANNFRGQINYDNSWGKSMITAIGGIEVRQVSTTTGSNTTYGYNLTNDTFQQVDYTTYYPLYPSQNNSSIPTNLYFAGTLNRFRSYFSNAAYTFDGRYTFSASGRIDQSNFFGVNANSKSVPLWSTGLKWDIDKENFYHIDWLPSLKLRATYGFSGNLDKNLTAFTTALYYSHALFTDANYAILQNPPNPNLQWEKTSTANLGIDFGAKGGILSGSIEYYYKNGTNLIGDQTLAPSVGFVNPVTLNSIYRGNFAAMKGNGVDIQLNSKNIDKTFKWTSSFLFSHTTDRVTKYSVSNPVNNLVLYGNGSGGIIYAQTGKPVYGIYSYRWAGLDPTNGNPRGYANGQISEDYPTLTNPTQLSDVTYNGPANPTYFGGLRNTFAWKQISLSVNISYKMGYYFRKSSIDYGDLFNSGGGNIDFTKRWQKPGDEKFTNVPSMIYPDDPTRGLFYDFSSVTVDNGDHIRLQDVTLSYDLDKSHWKRSPFSHLQFYTYANNLGIIWRANKDGLDPDYPRGGIPNPRSLSFGIRGNF
ncbi:MAG TPA: SusC/RagA family TonB-linked outer membrane protein [Mucilaginibacter sp.]|nr:SusC/RagA family TonB-linked outer membrane protein [Mucilaginibacter sp.]